MSESRVWLCKDGPLFGLIKTQTRASGMLILMELALTNVGKITIDPRCQTMTFGLPVALTQLTLEE